jgi:hypothetical protein
MARPVVICIALSVTLTSFASTKKQPDVSDPQAAAYVAQSVAAMTGGEAISDVSLSGTVTWTAGSDTENGTASLLALGTGESRMELSLSSGARSEIRDASTGTSIGKWTAQDGSSGKFAFHNCQTDAVWFFPALSSLTAGLNAIFAYVGQEVRNGETVQHLQSYGYQPAQYSGHGPTLQLLSTEDFYLDATTLLPSAITYNVHPDKDAGANLSVEVDFSDYQKVNGIAVPMHIQKYLQGTLTTDLTISGATFNSGIAISQFKIN